MLEKQEKKELEPLLLGVNIKFDNMLFLDISKKFGIAPYERDVIENIINHILRKHLDSIPVSSWPRQTCLEERREAVDELKTFIKANQGITKQQIAESRTLSWAAKKLLLGRHQREGNTKRMSAIEYNDILSGYYCRMDLKYEDLDNF